MISPAIIQPLNPPSGDTDKWMLDVTNRLNALIDAYNRIRPQTIYLRHQTSEAKTGEDGLMMWDAVNGCPVVSVGGV